MDNDGTLASWLQEVFAILELYDETALGVCWQCEEQTSICTFEYDHNRALCKSCFQQGAVLRAIGADAELGRPIFP